MYIQIYMYVHIYIDVIYLKNIKKNPNIINKIIK